VRNRIRHHHQDRQRQQKSRDRDSQQPFCFLHRQQTQARPVVAVFIQQQHHQQAETCGGRQYGIIRVMRPAPLAPGRIDPVSRPHRRDYCQEVQQPLHQSDREFHAMHVVCRHSDPRIGLHRKRNDRI